MKKWTILIALLVCVCLLAGCGKPAETQTPEQETAAASGKEAAPSGESNVREAVPQGKVNFIGGWQDSVGQRASMTVIPTQSEGDYAVLIRWGSSAFEATEWTMSAVFNTETAELEYQNGMRFERSYSEDGLAVSEKQVWSDSKGGFRLNDAGEMEWTDDHEEQASSCRFVRVYTETPSAAEFIENFFRPVGKIEQGTAGSSLKNAATTCELVEFTDRCELWNNDPDKLRATLADAWQQLTEDERSAFGANYSGVTQLMTATLKSLESRIGTFEDAGVGDRMRELMANDFARFSWATLFANIMPLDFGDSK